jgi:hypothetical protein
MPGKRPKPEEIASMPRQVEVLQSRRKTAAKVIGSIGFTEVTYTDGTKSLAASNSIRLRD